MLLGTRTYYMLYLFEAILFKFLMDTTSWLLARDWYLPSSQVTMHSTHWIQPSGPPQSAQNTPHP